MNPSEDILRAASMLSPTKVYEVVQARSGANSQIYRVRSALRDFALKRYPRRVGDQRQRLDVEWRSLMFLRSHGVLQVPEPIARDGDNFLLMEWIEGEPVDQPSHGDLLHASEFLKRIFALSDVGEAQQFPFASEACLSVVQIMTQIERRLSQLASYPEIDAFLHRELVPSLQVARVALAPEIAEGLDIAPTLRRLIPADFGFHNAIRQNDGLLRYIDFDYFGWDDPAKLAADIILHPAMTLNQEQTRAIATAITAALPADRDFVVRLQRHLPLYAVRWALILLNSFRADRVADLPADQVAFNSLVVRQLERARRVLARVSSGI